MARGEGVFIADQRDVQTQMMSAELNHPRPSGGGLTEERNIIFIVSKHRRSTATAGPARSAASAGSTRSAATAGSAAVGFFQDLVALDDLHHLFIAPRAQGRRHQRHGRVALRFREITQAQAAAFDEGGGKIRPALSLGIVLEIIQDPAPLGIIQRGEEFVCGLGDCSGRPGRRRVALGKTTETQANANEDHRRN